ncbi:sugar porter family MFS transporter [bacterium]|nr:sugar porter family MFS transporter [bacterium]
MLARIIFWSITASLAGFLFGFDTVVISGAEKSIQGQWHLSGFTHGLVTSAALWGTVIGSLIGFLPTDQFGRKKTLLSIGVLYFVSAVWSGLATGPMTFIIARWIGGLGVGISTVAAPLYISEISPPNNRGKLAGMFQFNIVFGILIAYVSNALIAYWFASTIPEDQPNDAWRWMLAIEAIPALIYSLFCFGLTESPRWLITRKGDREAGLAVLRSIVPSGSLEQAEELADDIVESAKQSGPIDSAHLKHLRLPMLLAVLIAFFNQLSGINAVLYFAPRILEETGLGKEDSLTVSIGIGIVNLIFTFAGLALIDYLGRRTLMIVGSLGYIISLGGCALAFYFGYLILVPPFLFLFIASHAVGQGAVIWVFISEIFPTRYRAMGQALGSFTHWFFAATLTFVFPMIIDAKVPSGVIFSIFCGMMVLQLVWVITMMPETKGVPLEEIERQLGVHE